jgi:hypothetical protein
MINAAAPDGAPPRRIKTVEKIIYRFSWFGCERAGHACFYKQIEKKTVLITTAPHFKTGNSRSLPEPDGA